MSDDYGRIKKLAQAGDVVAARELLREALRAENLIDAHASVDILLGQKVPFAVVLTSKMSLTQGQADAAKAQLQELADQVGASAVLVLGSNATVSFMPIPVKTEGCERQPTARFELLTYMRECLEFIDHHGHYDSACVHWVDPVLPDGTFRLHLQNAGSAVDELANTCPVDWLRGLFEVLEGRGNDLIFDGSDS